MLSNTFCNAAAGFLFFLVSVYLFDLACREQYIDNTPFHFESAISPSAHYKISFFLFFITGAISLVFLVNQNLLLIYMFVQLATIAFSFIKISRADSRIHLIVTNNVLNCLLLISLILLK